MVVDVHDELRTVDAGVHFSDAPLVRAVHREQHALLEIVRQLAPHIGKVEEAVLGRRRCAPERYITTSFPSARRPSAAPSIEPSASPSGFSCVTTRKRSLVRIASATAFTSPSIRSVLCIALILVRHGLFGTVVSSGRSAARSSISFVMRTPRSTESS